MKSPIFPNPHCLVLPAVLMSLAAPLETAAAYPAPDPEQKIQRGSIPMLKGKIDRPLRYTPDDGGFVIVNGKELFNRPLYGGSSPFRVDGGDIPEFSFYLPGRGGNVRLGFATGSGMKWFNDAAEVKARYSDGGMVYEIRDPLLGKAVLRLSALATRECEGLLLKMEVSASGTPVELLSAYGGIEGGRGGRDGDVGCERLPVREFFQFKADYCKGNQVTVRKQSALVQSASGTMSVLFPSGTRVTVADGKRWDDIGGLSFDRSPDPDHPLVLGRVRLVPGTPAHIGFQHVPAKQSKDEILKIYQDVAAGLEPTGKSANLRPWSHAELPSLFEKERKQLTEIARRVSIETPDPFINSALPALVTASDGVWDDRIGAYLHGGVAWRTPLLGWRVAYSGDVFGWHDRTRAHFDRYAAKQNTSPVSDKLPPPEENSYLARNETALHSNGDMTSSHYDMNMVGVDTIFRHLLWTGDLDYARKIWPVIERHLAWERRLFRREFGPEKLPLYEAYACIWASDSLAYNGGGATHSSAYNLYHNRMASRIARMLGHDPSPYDREAGLIEKAMDRLLWIKDKGWFAEGKDLLGDQALLPEAAAWTFYHTVDSAVPDSKEAWQMSRFVDTRLPHLPVTGPGVPAGYHTVSTTSWMPWIWSLNNVVMGESAHTAHALWQSGRDDAAFKLFKGAILDSMYLGICPGNVGMCTWYDVNRRESQRDFGDGVGALSRAFMEGLFGITPDLLAGEMKIRPGFPADWNEASMHHPSFDFSFERRDETDFYQVATRFQKPVAIRLDLVAPRDDVASVTANGNAVDWKLVNDAVGKPRIEIVAPAAPEQRIVIRWSGKAPVAAPAETTVTAGARFSANAGAPIREIADPQAALKNVSKEGPSLSGNAVGSIGHRTVFAQVNQGKLSWWQPLDIRIEDPKPARPIVFNTDWNQRLASSVKLDVVPLESFFNEQADGIFRQDYVSPRPAHVSLSLPRHGYGSWCHPKDGFDVDDAGIRASAAKNNGRIVLPNGVPLATPGDDGSKNIAYVSRWDNFPREISVPLSGRASKIHLLMAGSTDGMKSRRDNGEVLITYADGSSTRLALENPTTWWPIDQDYFIDDHAFSRPGPLPVRVDLKTGKIRVLDPETFKGKGRGVSGGSATVLDIDLDPAKEVKSLTVRAIANEVVIGLMSATLQRP